MRHRRAPLPGFHTFIVRTVGDPRHPARFCWDWFARPLREASFVGFWRRWNPVYGYVLLYFIYRPLRRVLPRPAAVLATFLVSGFALHDVPFGNGLEILRGQAAVPEVTILMGIFGVMTVASRAAGLDLSAHGWRVRASVNATLLLIGFALRHLILYLIRR